MRYTYVLPRLISFNEEKVIYFHLSTNIFIMFLARALHNNASSFEFLKQFWILNNLADAWCCLGVAHGAPSLATGAVPVLCTVVRPQTLISHRLASTSGERLILAHPLFIRTRHDQLCAGRAPDDRAMKDNMFSILIDHYRSARLSSRLKNSSMDVNVAHLSLLATRNRRHIFKTYSLSACFRLLFRILQ